MGDPKKPRKKFDKPSHPWIIERIQEENELVKNYGLKNKREVWKAESMLRSWRRQARDLQARIRRKEAQAEVEMKNLFGKLQNLGVLTMDNPTLDDVLALDIEKILSRRLETLVYTKGLASSYRQARQLIVHGHISVNGHKVTVPSYLVKKSEEPTIQYLPKSPLNDPMHPCRPKLREEKDQKKEVKEVEPNA
ncbi:MAG: 30S ribosomal protein S4 [Thermoplasmata archaeon]|nr:30S ribosomal protein S4 [Thermoplasmata archaeon]